MCKVDSQLATHSQTTGVSALWGKQTNKDCWWCCHIALILTEMMKPFFAENVCFLLRNVSNETVNMIGILNSQLKYQTSYNSPLKSLNSCTAHRSPQQIHLCPELMLFGLCVHEYICVWATVSTCVHECDKAEPPFADINREHHFQFSQAWPVCVG